MCALYNVRGEKDEIVGYLHVTVETVRLLISPFTIIFISSSTITIMFDADLSLKYADSKYSNYTSRLHLKITE